nr:PREDICTED: scavenger receptor class B member 1-like [Bemisia tabaci]XP_018914565.1 PREDICTED: scavenger receptor class B member 1-like [Bemisia tabaci]XP_018914566.1 PREDICTED: scavenger receptor class B member 1-like [Bemisia tabaci]XP_018914567.1 PREDICTED: scavenger receptor class B member 1-like [Bemisia tabaci]
MKTHAISSERRSFFRRNLAEVVVPTILDPKKSLDAIDIPKDIEFVKKTCRKDNLVCRVLARLCGLQTDPRCDVSFDGSAEEQASVFISRKLEGDPGVTAPDAASGETASSTGSAPSQNVETHQRTKLGSIFLSIIAVLITSIGCFTLVRTPYDILMNERLKMVRGLPAFDWWYTPPDEVLLRVYIFNITNSEEFLNGSHTKLHFQEIGPLVFREKLRHSNVVFNDNGTMTYVAHRTAHFLPEMTNINLSAEVIQPNLAVLGMSSYLWDASFFTKMGFNVLMNRLDSKPIVKLTVNQTLWNLTDPLLQVARVMAPNLVPDDNMGFLHQIYHNFKDEVTVFMGPENSRRFFTMEHFNGSPRLNHWRNETCDSVYGATEGVAYHQFITKNDTLRYFRKTMCRVTPLNYKCDVEKLGMTAYRFELPPNIFNRPADGGEECFNQPHLPYLPSGVSDVSPCYFDFPLASSFPHFLNADPSVRDSVKGMEPNADKHGSFVIVEPTTGVPMESRARSQSNLVVRQITGFPRIERFSNMIIPMFWAEYNQVGLPWYISGLMYFTVMILPKIQAPGSFAMALLGLILLVVVVRREIAHRKKRTLSSYSSLDLLPSTSSQES